MDILADAFIAHHHHIDALFERSEAATRASDWDGAATAFTAFRNAIETHMRTEEAFLFPTFEARFPEDPLIAILLKGHKDLRSFFDEIAEAIQAADAEEALDLIGTVKHILIKHDAKEEEELYPQLAMLIGDQHDNILLSLHASAA